MTLFEPPPENGELFALIDVKRGDAGKAKILVDLLASGRIQMVVKPIGGAGSGRTAYIEGQKLVFSQLPEGIAFRGVTAAIGHMAWIYPDAFQFGEAHLAKLFNGKNGLLQEMERFKSQGFMRGKLMISPRAALGMPWHLAQDMLEEILRTPDDIGTTANGMGPIAASYFGRNGLRMGDLLLNEADLKRRFMTAHRLAKASFKGLTDAAKWYYSSLHEPHREKLKERFGGESLHWFHTQDCLGGDASKLFNWLLNVQKQLRPYIQDIDAAVVENRRRKEGCFRRDIDRQ